ncbi:hypothetical protein BCY89_00150 [Sphingobacterium siyangense]|uniref:Alpha-galactosidase n=1 Tax=Sphingobacterium siyangense TaxID=459529 RepID=A0A420GBQ7_9SPHI|nr:hypothetical protein [Sphingobacterium siyangense]RKF42613.1 hypothetical protein BCY89_00150 [Sphingobacterium siyangense]
MKYSILFFVLMFQISPLMAQDWMIDGRSFKTTVKEDSNRIILENGLLRRVFLIGDGMATIALDNLMTGESELRAVRPEASLTIAGKEYLIGGMKGQAVNNYLDEAFLQGMSFDKSAFVLKGYRMEETQARFSWKPNAAWISNKEPWPAPGKRLVFTLTAAKDADPIIRHLEVKVYIELYDGAPIISKWIEVINQGEQFVKIDAFKSEILALVETAPKVHYGEPHEIRMMALEPGHFTRDFRKNTVQTDAPRDYIDRFTQLFVVTDYAMGGDMEAMKDNPAVRWVFDHPEYEWTGIRYYGQYKPARLEVSPLIGPGYSLSPGHKFESCRAFELLRDATDQERRGLAERKFWRMMAPWTQENPIFMHVRSAEPDAVRQAIDQAAKVGFEMVIMTFGSGFKIEEKSPAYLDTMKQLSLYAQEKGIALGGYSLLASRGAKEDVAAISLKTGKPAVTREEGSRFGLSPCLATDWGKDYFKTLKQFFAYTGMNVFENDGSYPGDPCASTVHSGHQDYHDSQWKQWLAIREYYQWCRAQGIYLNVPDWYFLSGSNKTPMGYVETNWSLPRAQQEIIERQNVYDGTWQKTPSMGFMFVPLTQYHGGGEQATIEPLHEHLDHYETRLRNLFGAGVQACYRGPRLYDTEDTQKLLQKWVGFYKTYRDILDSDIIHLRRPDGRDWDGLLHVSAKLKNKGFLSLYNPLSVPITREIKVPLYYTGLTDRVNVSQEGMTGKIYRLERDYTVKLKVTIPAKGYTWYLFQ